MSPRRKQIKRERLLYSQLARDLKKNSIPYDSAKIDFSKGIGHFVGFKFIEK